MSDVVVTKPQLNHEKLDVYRAAVALDALVLQVCRRAPRGNAWLVDQAQRAAGSTVLNLVEGTGREGQDRIQHYRIARGSALETDAAMTLLAHRGLAKAEEQDAAKALAVRLVSMLTAMMRR
jgi:four helix bundle protein